MRWRQGELSELRAWGALERQGITTFDGLCGAIGKDKGISALVETAGVDRSQLIEDLTTLARRKADEKGTSWARRHALDLLLAAAFIAGVFLIGRAVPRADAAGVALRDLRQGEQLSAESFHSTVDLGASAGLRLKRRVDKGGYVYREDLVALPTLKPEQLQGRLSVRLPLSLPDLRRLPSLPGHGTFAVVSKGAEGAPATWHVFCGVPILSAEREEESASFVVALTAPQIKDLLPLLDDPRVFPLRPPP